MCLTLQAILSLRLDRSQDVLVLRKCVSVQIFTLLFLEICHVPLIHVTQRHTHNELVLSPQIDMNDIYQINNAESKTGRSQLRSIHHLAIKTKTELHQNNAKWL